MVRTSPLWLQALRVLNYSILGITCVLLVRGIARKIRLSIVSETRSGRRTFALVAFGHMLFLALAVTAIVSVTERLAQDIPLNWRDWIVPCIYVGVSVYAVLVHRAEPEWNPDMRARPRVPRSE